MLNISQNLKPVNSFYAMAVLPVEEPSRKSARSLGFTPFSFCARIAWLPFASHSSPSLWLTGNSASPLLTAFFWGWRTARLCTSKPSSIGHLLLPMGLLPESSCLGEINERGKEEKEALSVGSAPQEGASNTSQEKTLLTTWSFALIMSFIYTWDCRNKCLRLMIWLLFVHCILQ